MKSPPAVPMALLGLGLLLPASPGLLAEEAPGAQEGPWEEVVFLPEKGLSVLLERDPRGVLLDRASYLDLHRRAREARGGAPAPLPGPAVRLLRCEVEGVVEGERARLRARLAISCRGSGRERLPLAFGGSVAAATLDGAPAVLSAAEKGGLELLVQGEGVHEAVVDLLALIQRSPGGRELRVDLPLAPVSRWSLEIPGRVTAIATESLGRTERLADPERTRLVAFRPLGVLRASWREGDEGTDLPPVVRGTIRTLVEVGERAATAAVLLRLEVSRRPQGEFAFALPGDLQVLGVEGEGASLLPAGEPAGGLAPFVLRFPETFTGSRTVLVRGARALPGPGSSELPVVDLPAAAVADRRMAVRFTDGLRGFVEPGPGAARLDPALSEQGAVDAVLDLGSGGTARAWSERPSVRCRADIRALLDLAEDGPWLAASFLFRPLGDRLYGVDPRLPPGFVPDSVAVSGDPPFLRGTTPGGRLAIVFPGGIPQGSAVAVSVRGRLPAEGWTAEDWTERSVPFPTLDAGAVEGAEGFLGVAAPPGLEVREEGTAGLEAASVGDLRTLGGFTAEGLTLGYRFRGGVGGGSVRATRLPPTVTATVAVVGTPFEDHLRFEAWVAVAVQRSGIREARLRVTPAVGDLLRIEGPDVSERRRVPGDGGDTWVVRFARRVRDGTAILLRADLPLAADPGPKSGGASLPLVVVEGAVRQDLLVGVEGAGELEVTTAASGLREADPADLAPFLGPRAAGLLRAWKAERSGTPAIEVRVARLPAAALPAAFADSVSLATVVGMDGIARTRLSARVRNADRQSLEVLLPPDARLHSARVAGEAVRPVRGEEGRLLIPVVPSAEPFEVVLFYEEPAPAEGGVALVSPRLGIPGARAVWTVHGPEGSLLTEAGGDFSAPPAPPGKPVAVRMAEALLDGLGDLLGGGTLGLRAELKGAPPSGGIQVLATAPVTLNALVDVAEEAAAAAKPGETARRIEAGRRIEARAAKRGLFGMDIPLLAAGPSVTATRLGPGGTIEVRWRSGASRTSSALLTAVVAFLLSFLARRRGIPAPTWTLLAVGLLTALPVVLGAADTAAFDGAVLGTLAFAALALLSALDRKRRAGRSFRLTRAAAAALLCLAVLSAPAEAKGGGGRKAAPAAAAETPPSPTVYVPYDPSLPETLRTPERVFLPYERYRELWNAAHPEERMEAVLPPVLLSSAYEARVEGRVFVAAARYEVDPLDGGLVALPPGAAAEEVRLDGKPVPVVAAPGGTAVVLVPRGDAAGGRTPAVGTGRRRVLEATLRWPVEGPAPGGSVRAAIPRTPGCRVRALLPLADAVVTMPAVGGGWSSGPDGDGTRVEAEFGPVDGLVLSWQPRGADAAGGRTRFEAATEAVASVRPDRLDWSAAVTLRVLSGTLADLEVSIPADLVLHSAAGLAVASWTVAGEGPERRLLLRLAGAGPGAETQIALAGFLPIPPARAPGAEGAVVPDLAIPGAAADRMRVAVTAASGRLAVLSFDGMERTEVREGDPPAATAFRRVRGPARLLLRAEPFPADLRVASRQHLHLGASASTLRAEFDLEPGPAGLHEARIRLPEGWTLEETGEAGAAFVEDGLLRLVFPGSPATYRRVALLLRGPSGGPEAQPFPLLRVEGAARESADLLVSTPPGFAAGAASADRLDPVPADRFAGWPPVAPGEVRSLAWRAARGDGGASVRREALRPTVRPAVVAEITALDDRAIVDALLLYEVRGGPERSFRFLCPPGVKDAWVLGEGIREVRREPAGDRERVTVVLQAPSTGEVAFRALYEVAVPAGGVLDLSGPEPLDGEGARAFLLLRALGDAEVRPEPGPGVEACDVADLPRIPEGLDPRRVLRFYRARDAGWRLGLRLVAHGLGNLPEARVHLVEATTVVDRDGSSRTRVDVRLFNRARSFLPVTLTAGAALESVLAGGVPVRPVTRPGEPGVLLVPVRVQSLGEGSQVVSVTFSLPPAAPGGRFGALEPRLPEFPGVPADATTWRVLLPADREYSFGGNLDPVEEVEVRLAQAEAYASDMDRLRQVVARGTLGQQTVAAENLVANTRALRSTLDDASARIDELEKAASEGRVDPARLAQGRQRAKDLMRDLDQTLAEARSRPQAEKAPDSRGGEEAQEEQSRQRYETKEGQADKNWGGNKFDPRFAQKKTEEDRKSAEESRRALAGLGYGGKGKGDDGKSALQAHEGFDALFAAGRNETIGVGGGQFFSRGVGGGGGGSGGRSHSYLGAAGGGGGGGGILVKSEGLLDIRRANVQGVVSLAPPLVEQGRAYAFRRLGAGAALRISPRAQGLGRRLGAAAGFLLLFGLVYLLLRRRAGPRG